MRQEYQEALKNIPKENLIYLDESGFDLTMKKDRGWKTKGQRLYDNKKGQRKYSKRITVISAYSNQTRKLIAPFYFEGNTNSQMFNLWLKEILLPELKPNQTIIMDNAAFHKNKITEEIIKSAKCNLLYLPPYSPDFNPIEQKWGHVKNQEKKLEQNLRILWSV